MDTLKKESDTAVLIFGTFNPITNAHVNMGLTAKRMIPDSDIIYVPARDAFLKGWKKYDDSSILKDRILLLYSVTERLGFKVTDIELDGTVDGRSVNTISYMKEHPGYSDVWFCMGTDKLNEITTWYKADELLGKNRFLVFKRAGSDEAIAGFRSGPYYDNFTFVDDPENLYDVSSTLVRKMIFDGNVDAIKDLVPPEVYEHYKGLGGK